VYRPTDNTSSGLDHGLRQIIPVLLKCDNYGSPHQTACSKATKWLPLPVPRATKVNSAALLALLRCEFWAVFTLLDSAVRVPALYDFAVALKSCNLVMVTAHSEDTWSLHWRQGLHPTLCANTASVATFPSHSGTVRTYSKHSDRCITAQDVLLQNAVWQYAARGVTPRESVTRVTP
jgi:hypothetical protein